MKKTLTLISLFILLLSAIGLGQFRNDKALYSLKHGLIFSSQTLIMPHDNLFFYEKYMAGGGIFFGGAYRDTLIQIADTLVGKHIQIIFSKNKYFTKYYSPTEEGKFKHTEFEVLDTCDSKINLTRNWNYKERIRYHLHDSISKYFSYNYMDLDFGIKPLQSNQLCAEYCHDLFIVKADSIYNHSLNLIAGEYNRRKDRYERYSQSLITTDQDFLQSFLNSFVSCSPDQRLFYDILLNHTENLFYEINNFTESQYSKLSSQVASMPKELNPNEALIQIKNAKTDCIYKERLIKDIKFYWVKKY